MAVKLLRPEYADHPETLERFREEAKHAGALNHPCVAQVHDYGHAGPGGPPYLVMEFVDGPSLADLLAAEPVAPEFALDVLAQAASALQAAHRTGMVHRDVKPGNILIGTDGRVKITDFGLAYAAGQAPITGPGLVMGTANYMAPERITGGAGTPASDLYALGIVLHECLTGLPPYDGTAAEVMAGHLYMPLPPLPAGVPPELDTLVARLTAKDPARRMADAGEVSELAARLRDEMRAGRLVPAARRPSQSGAPTLSPPLAVEPARQRTSGQDDSRQDDSRQVPGQPAPRRRRAVALTAAAGLLVAAALTGVLTAGALGDQPSAGRSPASGTPAPTIGAVPPGSTPASAGSGSPSDRRSSQATKARAAKHGHKPAGATPSGREGATSAAATSPVSAAASIPAPATPSATPSAPSSPAPTTTASPGPSPAPSNCLLGVVCLG